MCTVSELFVRVAPGHYTLAYRAVVTESLPPADFMEPVWDETKRCHNWRSYVPEGLVPLWSSLPPDARAILAADYERLANLEIWD